MEMSLSKGLTEILIRNHIIEDEEKALYVFGFHYGFMTLLNIATTLFIGLLFCMLWQSAIFLVCYIPLRIFAGGYHAKTPLRCYVMSSIMVAVILLLIRSVPWDSALCIAVLVSGAFIIGLRAPVANPSKPLDALERKVYRSRTLGILLIEGSAALLLLWVGLLEAAVCIAVSVGMLGLMVLPKVHRNDADD